MARTPPPRGRLGPLSPTYIIRNGSIYKGFLGDSGGWRVVGIVYFGFRFIKRMLGKTEQIVATDTLQPGHVLRIEAIPMKTRADRRAERASRPIVIRSGEGRS